MRKIFLLVLFIFSSATLWSQQSGLNSQQIGQLVQRMDNGETISVKDLELQDLQFEINFSELDARHKKYLDAISALMIRDNDLHLEIKGFTDPFTDEFEITANERAESVLNYLVGKGIAADRFSSDSPGNENPLVAVDNGQTNKNRRVALSFTKEKFAGWDELVFRNGDRERGIVTSINSKTIKYRDRNGDLIKTDAEKITKIKFSDGDVLIMGEDNGKRNKKVTDSDKLRALFGKKGRGKRGLRKPEIFGRNFLVIQAGINMRSTLGHDYKIQGAKTTLPPLTATVEYGLTNHIGIGATYGIHRWGIKPLEFDYQYQVMGLRAAFHIWAGSNLDPYIGLGFTYHQVRFINDPQLCGPEWQEYHYEVNNSKWGIDPIIGIRGFFNERWGFFGEWGSDGLGFVRFGAQYTLIPKRRKSYL